MSEQEEYREEQEDVERFRLEHMLAQRYTDKADIKDLKE